MAELPTNFKDDILAETMGGRRRYQMIQNEDGTVSFVDVTQYEQIGSDFGQAEINQTNEEVNKKFDSGDVVDPVTTTELGFAADAKLTGDALAELNAKMDGIILWENPNPTADFAGQTINLPTTDYDYYGVYYWEFNGSELKYSSGKIKREDNTCLTILTTGGAGFGGGIRAVKCTGNEIIFGDASFAWAGHAAITSNTWCIPLQVIGYKS